jgi:hypothetical protein
LRCGDAVSAAKEGEPFLVARGAARRLPCNEITAMITAGTHESR